MNLYIAENDVIWLARARAGVRALNVNYLGFHLIFRAIKSRYLYFTSVLCKAFSSPRACVWRKILDDGIHGGGVENEDFGVLTENYSLC